jgi:hypothetical protein
MIGHIANRHLREAQKKRKLRKFLAKHVKIDEPVHSNYDIPVKRDARQKEGK